MGDLITPYWTIASIYKVDVLDSLFWSNFDSKDNERSTNAQLVNPWVSDEFSRSREKLFFLALQVHKEFVLSSTACRDNFTNLAMMWQSRISADDDMVIYSKRDREQAFPELLNTLFLFTPVISTTFASVQSFLCDIKEPERIGLLIVDEAGQAPPQMEAGALYRSKKAIIVGDPKQVEPVVTDDAETAIQKDGTISAEELEENALPHEKYQENTFPILLYNNKYCLKMKSINFTARYSCTHRSERQFLH